MTHTGGSVTEGLPVTDLTPPATAASDRRRQPDVHSGSGQVTVTVGGHGSVTETPGGPCVPATDDDGSNDSATLTHTGSGADYGSAEGLPVRSPTCR